MNDQVVSIITPCFNHGIFLEEAINSTLSNNGCLNFEHIIINDGSTDEFTLNKLEELRKRGLNVIDQENSGLAKARNKGISVSTGKYILPLDADNKIHPLVFKKAVDIMEQDPNISMTYTDARYFGLKQGLWKIGRLNQFNLLIRNQIDACALIRKETLDEFGGYDENMPAMGNEDWELWIRMLNTQKRFFYLEQIGFDYRTSTNSMVGLETGPKYDLVLLYLMKKYPRLYLDYYEHLLNERDYIANQKVKAILKILLNKSFVKSSNKISGTS